MRNPYYQGPVSDHFDGVRFFNPPGPPLHKRLRDVLGWRWQSRHRPAWDQIPQTVPAYPRNRCTEPSVTMIGHASCLLQLAGQNWLIDPVWSTRASPLPWLGPRRYNQPAIAMADLPPIHGILITHNHYDHLDLTSVAALLVRHRCVIITPLGNDAIIRRRVPDSTIVTLDWWQAHTLTTPTAMTITLTPACHWSARSLRDRCMALWGGFFLASSQGSIYAAGDTAFHEGQSFRAIRERLGAPDLAVLPIGAYAPRWFMSDVHMDAREAVHAMQLLDAQQAAGMHWGTFRLTDEAAQAPCELLAQTLHTEQIEPSRFIAMTPGCCVSHSPRSATAQPA